MLKFSEEEREVTWDELHEIINNLKDGELICINFQPESEDSAQGGRSDEG